MDPTQYCLLFRFEKICSEFRRDFHLSIDGTQFGGSAKDFKQCLRLCYLDFNFNSNFNYRVTISVDQMQVK